MAVIDIDTTFEYDTDDLINAIVDSLLTFEIESFIVDLVEQENSPELARNLRAFLNDYLEEDN